MKLFNFLKKKQINRFEELLKKAANQPSYRTEFINSILDQNLIIISKSDLGSEEFIKLEPGAKINVLRLKDGRIPVFTSKERVHDKGIFKSNGNYIDAKARDIFELLKGATLVLNPYSDYGKEFNAGEIERLLNGTYFDTTLREVVYENETQVLIGQPAIYPTEIVNLLSDFFSTKPDVIAAYLGWFHDPSTNDPPHYIFAIDVKSDWTAFTSEMNSVLNQILRSDEITDFIQIDKSSFGDYFIEKTKPFYVKTV